MTLELELAGLEAGILGTPAVRDFLTNIDGLKLLQAHGSAASTLARKALAVTINAPKVEGILKTAAEAAGRYGVNDALAIIDAAPRSGKVAVSKAVTELIDGFDKAGLEAAAKVRQLVAAGAEPDAYLAPLYAHANSIKARATDVVNRAGNEGVTEVADEAAMPTVWVAETNACVVCLAYSGTVVKPGESFPGGLTYGRKSYFPNAVKTPPRHPRCRCTVEPLVNQEYADALRREADRSVLRGFSLESESMGTRIDAADRLVAKGVDAPKSVIAYSRKSIKAGKFPTRGRPEPGAPPPPTTPGKGPGFPPNAPTTPSATKRVGLAKVAVTKVATGPVESPLATSLARQLADAKAEAARYATFSSKSMVKTRNALNAEVARLEKALAIERLGGSTPLLEALPKTGAASISAVVDKVNPGRAARAYDNNCSSCVAAAELRARGYNVIAAKTGRKGRYGTESAAAWRDTDGLVRPFTTGLTEAEAVKLVESWPEGSRGFVSVQWKMSRSGHIFTVEKKGGRAVFHEPQVPDDAVGGAAGHLGNAVNGKIGVLRVDDLVPTDALAEYVEADTAKVRAALAATATKKAAIRAELDARMVVINGLDAKIRVLARTDAEKAARLELVVEKNALAAEFNKLRKSYMRL